VNANYYASANEAITPYLDPEIRDDPIIFPSQEVMTHAEVYMPLSTEGDALYQASWDRFKVAVQ
jgi:spermidine/putrescine-binding protein